MDLMDHPPVDQLAEVHADIAPGDAESLAEVVGCPVVASHVEQGEQLAHRRVDPPGPGHHAPVLDELPDQFLGRRACRRLAL